MAEKTACKIEVCLAFNLASRHPMHSEPSPPAPQLPWQCHAAVLCPSLMAKSQIKAWAAPQRSKAVVLNFLPSALDCVIQTVGLGEHAGLHSQTEPMLDPAAGWKVKKPMV